MCDTHLSTCTFQASSSIVFETCREGPTSSSLNYEHYMILKSPTFTALNHNSAECALWKPKSSEFKTCSSVSCASTKRIVWFSDLEILIKMNYRWDSLSKILLHRTLAVVARYVCIIMACHFERSISQVIRTDKARQKNWCKKRTSWASVYVPPSECLDRRFPDTSD